MNKNTILCVLSGLCAILFLTNSSCDPDPDNGPTLSVQPTTITLEADGTGQTISVSSNTSWTAVPRDSWLKCSPAGGTGGKNITVSADINTGDERSTKLILSDKTGRVTAEVRITQKKGDSPTPTPNPDQTLSVNPSSLNFNSSAGSNTFTITSNTSWTVKSDQTWCTVNTASGSNNSTVTVNVTENTSTSAARNATITVSNSNSSATILVNQKAASASLSVSTTSINFNESSGSKDVTIKSNTSWEASSSEDWLTVSPSQGTGDGILTLTAEANTTTSKRDATVTIKYGNSSTTISVSQNTPISEESSETITVKGISFKMIKVEGGTFTMGATEEQGGDTSDSAKPTHQVTLSSYYIGETEVTQELWEAVMGSNPSHFKSARKPVETVSWDDCQTFITKLNSLTGKIFRLPTEAEWEFAARGGNNSLGYKYAGSNIIDDVAWYYDNSRNVGEDSPDYGTHTIGNKAANELGLYDMSGNVWEWCQDWYGDYSAISERNPKGPSSGSYRVERGGSWGNDERLCRISSRSYDTPNETLTYYSSGPRNDKGFRLAR